MCVIFPRLISNQMPADKPPIAFSVANDKHYAIWEIAQLWSLSERTIRRIFENEPGVLCLGRPETKSKRGYRTLRIPETVMQRVHRRLQIGG